MCENGHLETGKKIIWLIQANEPLPNIDKNQRLFRTGMLAKELGNRDIKVLWFAATFDHYTKTQRFECNTDVKVNDNLLIKLIYSPSYQKNISLKRIINHKQMAINFRKMIRELDKPDLIYCSFPTIELAEEATKYANDNNVKLIIDIRDLWPDIFFHNLRFPLNYLSLPYQILMNIKTKRIFSSAYCLNAVSDSALEWGLNKINQNKRNNDYSYFIGYNKAQITNQYFDQYIIPFIGTIGNQINYDFIINVANLLCERNINAKILICGDGPQLDYFKNKVGTNANIDFLGWIDSKEISKILSQSFLGLIPYKNTFDFQMGVGNKFGEYLSYSLPVIVTCTGEMEKLILENQCGICSSDADVVVAYIEGMMKNSSTYKQARDQAKKLFNSQLDSNIIYPNLVNYLEQIMEEKQ